MATKQEILDELNALAVTLGRPVPTTGTIAELQATLTEWQQEVAALSEEDSPASDDAEQVGDSAEQPGTTDGGGDDDGENEQDADGDTPPGPPSLVKFVAIVTLHVDAVDDAGEPLPIVEQGSAAFIAPDVFEQLERKKLAQRG